MFAYYCHERESMGSALLKGRVSPLSNLSTKDSPSSFFYIEMFLKLPESAEV